MPESGASDVSDVSDSSAPVSKGSCLCGGVRWEATGAFDAMARCHCRECRKASGAEFATNGSVDADRFRLLAGESLLREYESSPGNFRVFCRRCGSLIMKRNVSQPDRVRLRLGCLDTELHQKPVVRVFAREKLAFSEILDDVPTFDTIPGA